ncbi:protein of unknown function [Candidatus Nitrotoga arctica]|uniref:Uncharacterized protein n=1 Tax=Candidatus Nitrotoga arctica TaxID=453162 RepID=A0ABN8AHV5_9PROT|nr:protein of unknown function [Candidatus Nitrotoga arctica]
MAATLLFNRYENQQKYYPITLVKRAYDDSLNIAVVLLYGSTHGQIHTVE